MFIPFPCKQITQLDQRIHRLNQQIKDTKQSTIGATAEGIMLFDFHTLFSF